MSSQQESICGRFFAGVSRSPSSLSESYRSTHLLERLPVVSLQVVSLQIEVDSLHDESFRYTAKSIRYMS